MLVKEEARRNLYLKKHVQRGGPSKKAGRVEARAPEFPHMPAGAVNYNGARAVRLGLRTVWTPCARNRTPLILPGSHCIFAFFLR